MKKVLITGATASQTSGEAHKRNPRFAGLLNTSFSFSGVHSEMKSLPIDIDSKDISTYDKVIVGLAPITSLSANKMYTALRTLGLAMEQDKAVVLLDAPDPSTVYQSFNSVLNNPDILKKALYSKRDGFDAVISDEKLFDSMLSTISKLVDGAYTVVVPALPYFSGSRAVYGIPNESFVLVELNFDGLFSDKHFDETISEPKYWSAENHKIKWTQDISKTVSKPVIGIRRSPYDSEFDYIDRMRESIGFLLPTYKNGTPWWSYNTMLALSCGVPVFSDWRHTGALGLHWSGLPHIVEEMTKSDRQSLAMSQRESYLRNTPNWTEESAKAVKTLIS